MEDHERETFEKHLQDKINMQIIIERALKHVITSELQDIIIKYVKRDCYGCQVDHPSQIRHTLCLFSTPKEWIDLYLVNAFRDLDLTKVEDQIGRAHV